MSHGKISRQETGPLESALLLDFFRVIFLGVGIWLNLDQHDFEAKAGKATGTVIEVKRETKTATRQTRRITSTVYRPVIRFEAGGRSYAFTSSTVSSGYNYPGGTRLENLYDPANPGGARIADDTADLIAILFIGVADWFPSVGYSYRWCSKAGMARHCRK